MKNNNSLEAFLTIKNEKAEKNEINWAKRKEEWLSHVNALFGEVEQWLSSFSARNLLKIDYEPIILSENYIGTYESRKMIIGIAGEVVTLTPVATLIIGASGRIDMEGDQGLVKLLLVGKRINALKFANSVEETYLQKKEHLSSESQKIELEWKITINSPSVQFLPLTQESFSDVLMEVMRSA